MEQRRPISSLTKEEEAELKEIFKECLEMDGETSSAYVERWFINHNFDIPQKHNDKIPDLDKPHAYRLATGEIKWEILLTKEEVNACYDFVKECRAKGIKIPIPRNALNKLFEAYVSANDIIVNGGGA